MNNPEKIYQIFSDLEERRQAASASDPEVYVTPAEYASVVRYRLVGRAPDDPYEYIFLTHFIGTPIIIDASCEDVIQLKSKLFEEANHG